MSTSCRWTPGGVRQSSDCYPHFLGTDSDSRYRATVMQYRGILPSGVFLLGLIGLVLFLVGEEIGAYRRNGQLREPRDWVLLTDTEYGGRYYPIQNGQLLGQLVEGVRPRLSDRLPESCRQIPLKAGTEIRIYVEPGSEEPRCLVSPMSEQFRYLLGMPLNVNRAGEEELILLPGIGPKLARRIVEVRESIGCFTSPEEFLRVPGIGKRLLQRMQGRVCFDTGVCTHR